ncbi:transglycosylase SLT domain-containing protein [Prevotella sp.]|uniref:transglycosylase SLT domain-containing protein n=1 Tax=Prevotella sp. TaxID=59823 RepID=UPI0027E2692E|nr:transglycosylase SLT domain-containing protein [Prevotella sp.]
MIKLFRVVLFIVCVLGTSPVMGADVAAESGAAQTENFDWEPVIKAIVQVESEGNTRAVKGNSCGAMQITPILVAECNNILKKRKSKKRYTLRDRFSLEKSKEMFLLMQSHFNPLNDIEKAIRSWNGGNKYSVKRTQRYFEKVMKCIQSQK